jgi:hypothetical protein
MSIEYMLTEDHTPMKVAMLGRRLDLAMDAAGVAKSEFQMRDLRAKAVRIKPTPAVTS